MQKWCFFVMGAMSGVIALLSFALLSQSTLPAAHAVNNIADGSMGVLAVPGMSGQDTQDMLWVIHKGQPVISSTDTTGIVPRPTGDKVTLALYRIEDNGRAIKLAGVRDISYDIGFVDYKGQREATVKDVYKELKDELEKAGKKK